MTQDMWNLKRNDTNELTLKTETDSQNELVVARGEGWWAGIVREFGISMYSPLHL